MYVSHEMRRNKVIENKKKERFCEKIEDLRETTKKNIYAGRMKTTGKISTAIEEQQLAYNVRYNATV